MELLQALSEAYDKIPAGFWKHWLSLLGSLIAVSLERPPGLINWIIHIAVGYAAGFYLYFIPEKMIKAVYDDLKPELLNDIAHLAGGFGGMYGVTWARNYLKKKTAQDDNPFT